MNAAEILANMEEEGKKYWVGTKNSLVLYTIAGCIFELNCNYKPDITKKHAYLEEEVAWFWHNNAAL